MAKFEKLLLMVLVLFGALAPSLSAQQVTTEMISPLSGSFTITFPSSPICPASGQQDMITFTGKVHVVATVDAAANTVDYHINFLSVKGTGQLVSKYVANGATDLLDQGFPGAGITVPIQISANLYPNGPCRAAFPNTPILPSRRNHQLRHGLHSERGDGQRWDDIRPIPLAFAEHNLEVD